MTSSFEFCALNRELRIERTAEGSWRKYIEVHRYRRPASAGLSILRTRGFGPTQPPLFRFLSDQRPFPLNPILNGFTLDVTDLLVIGACSP